MRASESMCAALRARLRARLRAKKATPVALLLVFTFFFMSACSPATSSTSAEEEGERFSNAVINDTPYVADAGSVASGSQQDASKRAEQLRAELGITEDMRPSFSHGSKPADKQLYIMLHDTEGSSDPGSVISWWDSNGNLVATHFIVGKDGSIWQCVPLDTIAHHAGFGDVGHNNQYGITEDGRDDMLGTQSIGPSFPDYGMNAWSIGIEMVHIGGAEQYPEEQLAALDKLIAYLDAYYAGAPQGNAGTIIDHKAWRSGNSDTSREFAAFLSNYQTIRRHQ